MPDKTKQNDVHAQYVAYYEYINMNLRTNARDYDGLSSGSRLCT